MPRESQLQRRARAAEILRILQREYPGATCSLDHKNALQLLVATILAAQCTDQRVNLISPALFRKFRAAQDYAAADPEELKNYVKSTGFYNNKAKNLIAMGKILVERFGGEVPNTMDGLLSLPGVARKTANVILGTWFGKNEGLVVDTHVGRLALRLALAPHAKDGKDAVKIERDLQPIVPQPQWTFWSHALVAHGRKTCTARNPQCPICPLARLCPSCGKV